MGIVESTYAELKQQELKNKEFIVEMNFPIVTDAK